MRDGWHDFAINTWGQLYANYDRFCFAASHFFWLFPTPKSSAADCSLVVHVPWKKFFCGVVWKDLNDLTLQLEKLKQNYGGRLKVIWYFLVLFTWWKTMFSVYVIQLLFLVYSTLYSWLSFRFLLLLLLLLLFCFVVGFFFQVSIENHKFICIWT